MFLWSYIWSPEMLKQTILNSILHLSKLQLFSVSNPGCTCVASKLTQFDPLNSDAYNYNRHFRSSKNMIRTWIYIFQHHYNVLKIIFLKIKNSIVEQGASTTSYYLPTIWRDFYFWEHGALSPLAMYSIYYVHHTHM